jgi:hypothetical protein
MITQCPQSPKAGSGGEFQFSESRFSETGIQTLSHGMAVGMEALPPATASSREEKPTAMMDAAALEVKSHAK